MDVLPRITRQLIELFRTMSLIQRVTFVAVSLVLVANFGWLFLQSQRNSFQAVAGGKSFTAEELSAAESTLIKSGLTNYRREGRRLVAPASQLDRYNVALNQIHVEPTDFGSQMLKKFESLGPFTTDRQRQEMKDALLLTELRQMIKDVPEIEDARVAIANPGRRTSFGQRTRVTANITLKAKADCELSPQLISSLRQAVASMVPDLNASDVTVFDVIGGRTISGDLASNPAERGLLNRVRDVSRQYEQQIQKGLAFIPNVGVAVQIDIEQLKSSLAQNEAVHSRIDGQSQANRPGSLRLTEQGAKETPHRTAFRGSADVMSNEVTAGSMNDMDEHQLFVAIPSAIRANITIPRDYYRNVSAQRRSRGERSAVRLNQEEIEAEVLAKVERTVGRLIPSGSLPDAISVTTVDHSGTPSVAEPTRIDTRKVMRLAEEHGVSIVLSLFALIAVWMLMRLGRTKIPNAEVPIVPVTPENESTPSVATSSQEDDSETVPIEPPVPINPKLSEPEAVSISLPDEIRNLARTDPARAAAVLSQWLSRAA